MEAINPEFRELQHQVAEVREKLALQEGKIEQLNHTARDTSKQTIWQFVTFTIAIGGLLIGMLNYQTNTLNRQLDERTRVLEEQIKGVKQTVEQSEKNMNARFEDLKQEVRQRK